MMNSGYFSRKEQWRNTSHSPVLIKDLPYRNTAGLSYVLPDPEQAPSMNKNPKDQSKYSLNE